MEIKMKEVHLFDVIEWKNKNLIVTDIVSPTNAIGLAVTNPKNNEKDVIVGHKDRPVNLVRRW